MVLLTASSTFFMLCRSRYPARPDLRLDILPWGRIRSIFIVSFQSSITIHPFGHLHGGIRTSFSNSGRRRYCLQYSLQPVDLRSIFEQFRLRRRRLRIASDQPYMTTSRSLISMRVPVSPDVGIHQNTHQGMLLCSDRSKSRWAWMERGAPDQFALPVDYQFSILVGKFDFHGQTPALQLTFIDRPHGVA